MSSQSGKSNAPLKRKVPNVDTLIENPAHEAASMDAENQFDERLSFRKGWPMLPDLPLATIHDSNIMSMISFPDYAHHMNLISLELRQIIKRMHLVHRIASRDTPLTDKTATLLIVAVPNSPIDPIPGYGGELNLYSYAVNVLRQYLKDEGINVKIEVIDEQIYDWNLLPSDKPNHDADSVIVEAWDEAKPKVLKLLSDHGLGGSRVEFLLRGPNTGSLRGRPTVMIATGARMGAELLPELRMLVEPLIKVEVVSTGYGAI